MSINTGFSIPAKPPAWGCGMNYAPVLLLSRFSAMGAFIHTLSADGNSVHCITVCFYQPAAAQEE